ERILCGGRPLVHPAGRPGMAERTITSGSVSKEYRMIGWRIGWVVGPEAIMADVARVHIYNVVTPTGIAQAGARAALQTPPDDLAACVAQWQRRRDTLTDQLRDWPMAPAAGGWSQLLDVGVLGYDSFTASRLLLEHGKIAATPMRDWGEHNSDQFVRLVFSNEPVERLAEMGKRCARALS
ncbi:MAG: aminotransferase class I/II-fold pyridoxal phosphate-dependent enzyme, partial [Bacteroidetes bacterium]|nr:aminotransferase class I/II-fold pyridoxal phosphate-dependent enzyme [Bacteroidota bacterium]